MNFFDFKDPKYAQMIQGGANLSTVGGQMIAPDAYDPRIQATKPGLGQFANLQLTGIGTAFGPVGAGIGFAADMVKNGIAYKKAMDQYNIALSKNNYLGQNQNLPPDYTQMMRQGGGVEMGGGMPVLENNEIVLMPQPDGSWKKIMQTPPNAPNHEQGGVAAPQLPAGAVVFPQQYMQQVEQALQQGDFQTISQIAQQVMQESQAAKQQGQPFSSGGGGELPAAQQQQVQQDPMAQQQMPMPTEQMPFQGMRCGGMVKYYGNGGMVLPPMMQSDDYATQKANFEATQAADAMYQQQQQEVNQPVKLRNPNTEFKRGTVNDYQNPADNLTAKPNDAQDRTVTRQQAMKAGVYENSYWDERDKKRYVTVGGKREVFDPNKNYGKVRPITYEMDNKEKAAVKKENPTVTVTPQMNSTMQSNWENPMNTAVKNASKEFKLQKKEQGKQLPKVNPLTGKPFEKTNYPVSGKYYSKALEVNAPLLKNPKDFFKDEAWVEPEEVTTEERKAIVAEQELIHANRKFSEKYKQRDEMQLKNKIVQAYPGIGVDRMKDIQISLDGKTFYHESIGTLPIPKSALQKSVEDYNQSKSALQKSVEDYNQSKDPKVLKERIYKKFQEMGYTSRKKEDITVYDNGEFSYGYSKQGKISDFLNK